MSVFVIDVHSFVDVITNSSSELFVCDTDKAVKTVQAWLDGAQTNCKAILAKEDNFEEVQKMFQDQCWGYDMDKPEFDEDRYSTLYHKNLIGKILIFDDGSNGLMHRSCGTFFEYGREGDHIDEQIENMFNAERFHLG